MVCYEGSCGYLCRWLSIPSSFTSLGLYIRSRQLQLPLSSVVEEFKVAKWRAVMTYRDDEKVRGARYHHKIWTQMGSRHISGTGKKPVEDEGHHRQPAHWATGTRIHPLSAMGESRPKAEE